SRITTRLLRADFPNYAPLIPSSYPNKLVVSKESLLEALRRVRLLVRDAASSVRVTMHPDRIELVATAAEVGQAAEDLDASFDGTEMMLAFNPSFLIEGVEAVPGEEVLIETLDASKPALVRAVDSLEYRYLLMPVRVA
ncbi:MAG: DNA polymerase III subunit beta, partial [Acidimicrobiales bacterium]